MRIGVVGKRGLASLPGALGETGTVASVFCDLDPRSLEQAARQFGFSRVTHRFDEVVENADAIIIGTPMPLHAEQSIVALASDRHVLCEVTAAFSIDECWAIADAVQRSKGIYMMAENYCYLRDCVLVRELVRKGFFGTPTFGQGAYLHDVKSYHYDDQGRPTWRAHYQVGVDGCTYGTHSLGPVMQWMKVSDPADRVESVVCLGAGRWTRPEHRQQDTTVTLVQLASGRLIEIRLDMLSNRPNHAAKYALQGTQGVFECGPEEHVRGLVWFDDGAMGTRFWRSLQDYDEHLPPDWLHVEREAAASGHGGADFRVGRDFVRAARGEIAPPISWQDALEWTAAGLASTLSIENGGVPIRVPRFDDLAQAPAWLREQRENH